MDNAINIPNVILKNLTIQSDLRGDLNEIFRAEWRLLPTPPVQWNVSNSHKGAFRGMHVHVRNTDYLICTRGRMQVFLCDLRANTKTYKLTESFCLDADELSALIIPPFVAHAFYYHEASTHFHGLSHLWDNNDEFGCVYTDPEVGITLPNADLILSERDKNAGSLAELIETLNTIKVK